MSKRMMIIITMVLLVLITSISIYGTVVAKKQQKEIDNYLNYINSDEIGNEVKSPDFIHVVLAAYDGDVNGKTIVKSISYFENNILPEIQKKCGNKLLAGIYYSRHSNQLYKEYGITNKKEFNELVQKCKQIDMDNIKSNEFNVDSIEVKDDSLNVELKIKDTSNNTAIFSVRILNKANADKTSVIIK